MSEDKTYIRIVDEIDQFDCRKHPWMMELYKELVTRDGTRNEAIREIKNSTLTELEKIICAVNIGEHKAALNKGILNKIKNWIIRHQRAHDTNQ